MKTNIVMNLLKRLRWNHLQQPIRSHCGSSPPPSQGGMAPKRARVGAVDLTDAEARQLLETHVRAVDCSKERLFVYSGGRKDAPKWKCLHKHRHLLAGFARRALADRTIF